MVSEMNPVDWRRNSIDFNIDSGYLEGIVRGFKSGILKTADYLNLTQCDTLDDMKMHLAGTDYGNFLSSATEAGAVLTVATIDEKIREKLLLEFNYLRNHSVPPLSTFLDYITYAYMIDNIILLLTGTLHNRPMSELLPKCHPLGSFEQMEAVTVASTVDELYSAVLIDTPLAQYFLDCVSENDIAEVDLDIIRSLIYKAYLEDFHSFCCKVGPTTREVMGEILAFEADRRSFMIMINSIGTYLSPEERFNLCPNIGRLYPDGLIMLAKAEDYEQIRSVSEHYNDFRVFFEEAGDNTGSKTVEDKFFEEEINLMKLTFIQQFHFGIFYAYVRLREQENRNIVWIAECVSQRQRAWIDNYIPIF